ncbi:uncharacterized protein [Anas platyrhynchos]|uniref:uncharacterized protein n=1 Tax=Anas platyrhynchos TaxID=8839 RepID=UPI003AF2A6B1
MADMWGMSFFPSPEAFWAFYSFLWLLLMAVACYFLMPGAKPQEGRKTRHHCRRHQENRRVWTLHNSSWCKRNQCPEHAKVDGVQELAKLFSRNLEDFNKCMEMLDLELPEDSRESTTSDIESDTSCSSVMSLDSWHTISCTSIMENKSTQISWPSTPTPVQKADSLHGSEVQPGLMHPKAGPGKQRDHDTRPPCIEEVVRCHRASSVQQNQQHVQVQQAAPTHPPAVPKFQSTKLEAQKETQETQETLDCFPPKKKEEQKQGLPADVDKPSKDPASASKISKRAEKPTLKVIPMVREMPCVDKTVERHLEGPDIQKKIKRFFRMTRKFLASMKRFFSYIQGQKDSQTEAPQRNTRQRHCSPFQHFQQHAHTTKSAVQLSEQTPGPQQEAAAPKDKFTQGMKEPVHSVPATIPKVAQGMKPQDGGDKPRQKTGCGGRANGSSTTSKMTLPGTSKKNRGPGAAGLVCSPSPSTQAEQASPQSKGAPRGQSDKKGDGPSISATGDMGTPAPPRRRRPRRKHSFSGDRPSALPRPPHHVWIALDMPHMTKVPAARKECRKAKQNDKDLEKQVQASQSKQLPDNAGQPRVDTAAEGTGAVPRRRHRRARKDKGCSQDRSVFARLRPKCIKATLVPKERIWRCRSPEAFRGSMGCQAPWRLDLKLPEDSGEFLTSDTESDTSCSSRTSLDSWRTISCTTVTEDETRQISQASIPAPIQKAVSLHARPPCTKEVVVRCHRASSEKQKQTQETQETLDCFPPKKKEEQKLGLPADVDKPSKDPASASKITKQAEKPTLKVIPMVREMPCVDKTVDGHLEGPEIQKEIKRFFRVPRKFLDSMKRFFSYIQGQKDSQTLRLRLHRGTPGSTTLLALSAACSHHKVGSAAVRADPWPSARGSSP